MKLDTRVLNDLWMTVDGEPIISADGDFLIAQSNHALLQNIMFRLKTVIGDFALSRNLGASLETFVGMPNDPFTGKAIEDSINYALSYDGFLRTSDLKVNVFPVDIHTIGSLIEVTSGGATTKLAFSIDLKEGQLKWTL